MRTIQISTDVFAAIWAARLPAEDTEEAILRRVLKLGNANDSAPERNRGVGYADARYGVVLPAEFKIFRTYHGTNFTARASQGGFVLDADGKLYPTLNELSSAIGVKTENAWINWFYFENGERHPLADKRDPSKIVRRTRRV